MITNGVAFRMLPRTGEFHAPEGDDTRRELIRRTKRETERRLVLAGFSPLTAKRLSDIATLDEIREILAEMKNEETAK